MIIALWSAKGGVGVTACSVGASVAAARAGTPSLLVDAVGDVPAVCGIAEPAAGLWDWVCSEPATGPEALRRLEVPAGEGLSIVAAGSPTRVIDPSRLDAVAQVLSLEVRTVFVDLGTLGADRAAPRAQLADALRAHGATVVIVTRACYLALRAAVRRQRDCDAMIVVREPGRSLHDDDLRSILGLPVAASIDLNPAVSRSIDAGLLATRAPREFLRQLARASR